MPQKLETVLKHVEEINNDVNRQLIKNYHRYLVSRDTSTNYQKDNIKLIHMFAKFIGESKTLYDIKDHTFIVSFLDTRRKSKEEDPDERWTTTWNDYLWRLKMFYRWLYNFKIKEENQINYSNINNWNTPNFVNINKKKAKRLSPYNESEIWDREELLSIVKYEPYIPLNSGYLITFFKDRDKKNNQRIWLSANEKQSTLDNYVQHLYTACDLAKLNRVQVIEIVQNNKRI